MMMLQFVCFLGIFILSISIRFFPILLWGSVIHEYDPHFNFRATKYLVEYGFHNFLNWYDDRVWYPLGRAVGTTTYPGLMLTATTFHRLLHALHVTLDIRHICVLLSPFFSAFTCFALYFMTLQITKRIQTALLAAFFMAICPGYISRSTAGSYDNEGIAIFLLLMTFCCWIRANERKSVLWSAWTAISYFCMVFSWGGFVFIMNMIPAHVLGLMCWHGQSNMRNFETEFAKLYVLYSVFYILGTLLAMQVPVIGWNGIGGGELMLSHGTFIFLQAIALYMQFFSGFWSWRRVKTAGVLVVCIALLLVVVFFRYSKWTGRSLSLLIPTYAREHMPIIASVGEHQSTPWSGFYAALGPITLFIPLGVYMSFDSLNSGFIFMLLYATLGFYFAGIMIRLILIVAPAACFLSAVGVSYFIQDIVDVLRMKKADDENQTVDTKDRMEKTSLLKEIEPIFYEKVLLNREKQASRFLTRDSSTYTFVLLLITIRHSVQMSSKVFSSTSLIIQQQNTTSGKTIAYDDLREAFQWIRYNTPEHATFLTWWDYGYQLSQLGNRTVIIDNNTWNHTHIATVGRVLMSNEEEAMPILTSLNVDYLMITFGGKSGMHGDDLDKTAWMVRLSEDEYPDHILESDFGVPGSFSYFRNASSALKSSLLYRLSYHEFSKYSANVRVPGTQGREPEYKTRFGYDLDRNMEVLDEGEPLQYLTQVFTSEAWIIRIYKVNR